MPTAKLSKKEQTFSFDYKLSETRIENLKIVKNLIGVLTIEGMGYHWATPDTEFSVDIDFIKWNGTDIKPVLEVLDCWSVAQIQEAATSWVRENLFKSSDNHLADTALTLLRCKALVEERAANENLYFPDAIPVVLSDFFTLRICGACVSSTGNFFIMDNNMEWTEIKGTSAAEAKILTAVYAGLKKLEEPKNVLA